jgi:hypothetical protein
VVGVGDVFGNGMLLSEHIRLVAAFDHRHIFLDPAPNASTSYSKRKRLFDLPRSSCEDYNRELISAGGGIRTIATGIRGNRKRLSVPSRRTAPAADQGADWGTHYDP